MITQVLRGLRRNPAFALTVILSIGLGIGGNTVVFSLANTLFLRPLQASHGERLALVYTSYADGLRWGSTSYPDFRDLREGTQAFTDLSAERIVALSLGVEPFNTRVYGSMVSLGYFHTLGVNAVAGRTFAVADGEAAQEQTTIVLSHDLWQRTFGGEPGEVGRTLAVNGVPFTVIGVMPDGFRGVTIGYDPQFWVPMEAETLLTPGSTGLESRDLRSLFVIGRLADGVPLDQASAQLAEVSGRLAASYPKTNGGVSFTAIPAAEGTLHPMYRSAVGALLGVLFAIVGIVLLVACANTSALLLARAHARRQEIGIRIALGSSRRALIRQLLAESLVLALLGALVALVIAALGNWLLMSVAPIAGLPIHLDVTLDHRVLLFTLAVSLLTGLLFGLLPALQSTRPDCVEAIKGDTASRAGYRRSRLRTAFVCGQLVLSVVLLIAAGLLVRGLRSAQRSEMGFEPSGVATAAVDLGLRGYGAADGSRFYGRLADRLLATAGVESVAVASNLPLELFGNQRNVLPVGSELASPTEQRLVDYNVVDPAYFQTLRIRLLQGRVFSPDDGSDTPAVAVVSQTLAEAYWPKADPVGKRLTADGVEYQVVGVVGDTRIGGLAVAPKPFIYFPLRQQYAPVAYVLVRTAGSPESFLPALRRQVQDLDPALAAFKVQTLKESLEVFLLVPRLAATLLISFGMLAIVLASVGLYGILAYGISQRRREIGIRLSLGAERGGVRSMLVREGVRVALIGVALGLLVAAGLTRFMKDLLYGVSPLDLGVFVAATVLVLFVAWLASYLPAQRAVRSEPFAVLRGDVSQRKK